MKQDQNFKYIYLLYNEESDKYYIGQAFDLIGRFKNHLSSYKYNKRNKKDSWIKSLLDKGLKPKIQQLCICSRDQADFFEIMFIDLFMRLSFPLVNGTLGGSCNSGGHTEETKKKISESNKGRKMSPELNYYLHQVVNKNRKRRLKERVSHSATFIGNKYRLNISPVNKGTRKLSEETVNNILDDLKNGVLYKDLVKKYDTNMTTISTIKNGKYFSVGWGYESSNSSWKGKDKSLKRKLNLYLFS